MPNNNFDWDEPENQPTGQINQRVNVPNPNYPNDPYATPKVTALVKSGESKGKIHDGTRVRTHDDQGNPLDTTITF